MRKVIEFLGCGGATECLKPNEFEEDDPFVSLRQFARANFMHHLDDDDDDDDGVVYGLPIKDEDEFYSLFETTLRRRGWPVLKYGKGTTVKRCLQIEGDMLFWGSKKNKENTPKAVALTAIVDVGVGCKFDDAPDDVNERCCVAFNIANKSVLKIITHSTSDAHILVVGFTHLLTRDRIGGNETQFRKNNYNPVDPASTSARPIKSSGLFLDDLIPISSPATPTR